MEEATFAGGPVRYAIATFAGGCFWCTEAIFKRIKGVSEVVSGYSGGVMENPDYETVSSGSTGHAEAIQIEFDPKIISYEKAEADHQNFYENNPDYGYCRVIIDPKIRKLLREFKGEVKENN